MCLSKIRDRLIHFLKQNKLVSDCFKFKLKLGNMLMKFYHSVVTRIELGFVCFDLHDICVCTNPNNFPRAISQFAFKVSCLACISLDKISSLQRLSPESAEELEEREKQKR